MSRGCVTCHPVSVHTFYFDPCNTEFVANSSSRLVMGVSTR